MEQKIVKIMNISLMYSPVLSQTCIYTYYTYPNFCWMCNCSI